MKNFLLIAIVTILFGFSGCDKKQAVVVDKKEDAKLENNDIKENKEELKTKEEVNKQSGEDINKANELGMTPGLPANFPSDIPQPKNSRTLGSLNSSEGTVVTFESNDKVLDIVNFYKEELKSKGYAIAEGGESLVSDKGGLISWKKESKEVQLMLGFDKDKNITSLVITYK